MQLYICIFSTLAAVGLGVRKPAKVMGQQCYELWSWEKRKHANDLWRLWTLLRKRERLVEKQSLNTVLIKLWGVHLFELALVVFWYLCVYDSFNSELLYVLTLALWMHRVGFLWVPLMTSCCHPICKCCAGLRRGWKEGTASEAEMRWPQLW